MEGQGAVDTADGTGTVREQRLEIERVETSMNAAGVPTKFKHRGKHARLLNEVGITLPIARPKSDNENELASGTS